MADKCKVVKELVDELGAYQGLSRSTFKSWLQLAIIVGYLYEGWSAEKCFNGLVTLVVG